MFSVDLIVVGKNRKGPWFDLQQDYLKRMKWPVRIIEVDSPHTDAKARQEHEQRLILSKIDTDSCVVALDERGKSLRSLEFAGTLEKLRDTGTGKLAILIGGADGLGDEIRGKARILLSFGQQTWPHMMVRTMILEQLYRAQQIMAGHPYHREG